MPGLSWEANSCWGSPGLHLSIWTMSEMDCPTDLIMHSVDRSRPEFWFWFLFLGSERKVQLVVAGACEGAQDASVGTGSFHFHYPACWEQELTVHLQVLCLPSGTLGPQPLFSQLELCSPCPIPPPRTAPRTAPACQVTWVN